MLASTLAGLDKVLTWWSNSVSWAAGWYKSPRGYRLIFASSLMLPLAAATVVYYPSLSQWFFTDDFLWLEAASNPDLGDFIEGSLSFPRRPTPYWRPLIDFYFFSMYRVFQLDAGAYHTANLLLHGTVGALVVLLVHRVTRSLLTGLVAAVIFVIAPTYWTSVVWVSNATTLIAAAFALSAIVLYLWYVDVGERPILLGLGAAAFALALLAKETSFVVPGLMVVLGFAVWQQAGRPVPNACSCLSPPSCL